MLWEIRNLAEDDPEAILAGLVEEGETIAAFDPDAGVETEVFNRYPGLATPPDAEVVTFLKSLTGANGTIKVAFGTEGGLFSRDVRRSDGDLRARVPWPRVTSRTNMSRSPQIEACDAMLGRLVQRLVEGL